MCLNVARVIPAGPLISRYSGVAWYSSKALTQSAWVNGGMAPLIGFHSVIDRPLSVSRVIPPTTTIAKTSAATRNSSRDRASGWARTAAAGAGVEMEAIGGAYATQAVGGATRPYSFVMS